MVDFANLVIIMYIKYNFGQRKIGEFESHSYHLLFMDVNLTLMRINLPKFSLSDIYAMWYIVRVDLFLYK